jgi:hypothetical protein
MTNHVPVPAIPDVRVALDRLIRSVTLRADNLEVAVRTSETFAARAQHLAARDHALGRLHGLKEARELLDTLEAPAPGEA